MAALLPDANQLDRLGRELKCSICLSLFQQASSLSCNHTFCRSCILQSVKSKPSCPLCKVPTTRREIRPAPQMDSLVAIFVSMGKSAGIDFLASQPAIDTKIEPERTKTEHSTKKRKALSNITNSEKKMKSKTDDQKSSNHPFKGRILPKKRVQVPKPSCLKGELGLSKDDMKFTPKSCSGEMCELPDYLQAMSLMKGTDERADESDDVDSVIECTQMPKCKKTPKARKGKKVFSNKKTTEGSAERKHGKLNVNCESEQVKNETKEEITGPDNKSKWSACSPIEGDTGRIKLDPFFWLRNESSQDSEEFHVTQPTASLSVAQPTFSDLKDTGDDIDSDEEIAVARPSFSDLKDSDNEVEVDEDVTKDHAIVNDSDVADFNFDYAQQETEAFKFNRTAVIDSKQGAMCDLSLECSEHFGCKVGFLPDNVQIGSEISEDKLISPYETTGRIQHLDSTKKEFSLQGCKTSMNVSTPQRKEDMALDSRIDPLEVQHSEALLCDVTVKGELNPGCKRKVRKCEQLQKRRKCAVVGKAVCTVKGNALATDGKKNSEESHVNKGANSVEASSEQTKADELEAGKSIIQSPDLSIQQSRSSIYHPECVFCGSSKDSKLTGPMRYYNRNGVPVKEVKAEAKIIHVHAYCAEWAPDVYFVDDVAKNLTAESVRGQKMKCNCCGKKGAALGCCLKRCKKSYHYPCARSLKCKWDEDNFIMLCPEHASEKFPGKDKKEVSDHNITTKQKTNVNKKMNASISAEKTQMDNTSPVQKWQFGVTHKWVLCGSALDSSGKEQLASFAKLTGASLTKTWNSNVTHVIAGSDEHGAARRTLKFLLALLEGKWILKLDWLKACTESMKPVNEEAYEILMDIHGVCEGPKKARLRASLKGPKLFEGFQFYFMGDFLPGYRVDLQALVMAGGGLILHRKPVILVDDLQQKQTIIVYNNEACIGINKDEISKLLSKRLVEAKELGMLVRNSHVVPHHWILDSVACSESHAFPLK